jgi:hypothetical protein
VEGAESGAPTHTNKQGATLTHMDTGSDKHEEEAGVSRGEGEVPRGTPLAVTNLARANV